MATITACFLTLGCLGKKENEIPSPDHQESPPPLTLAPPARLATGFFRKKRRGSTFDNPPLSTSPLELSAKKQGSSQSTVRMDRPQNFNFPNPKNNLREEDPSLFFYSFFVFSLDTSTPPPPKGCEQTWQTTRVHYRDDKRGTLWEKKWTEWMRK